MLNFEPTMQAAQARLDAINPEAYARTRNALNGAVTRLSPYLTHGFLGLLDVYDAVSARHTLNTGHKLVYELGWRAYYRHVWEHLDEGICQSIHVGLLPDSAYQQQMPKDVLEARTGIAVIDRSVHELYATGYLHNHARMWLASYVVHIRKVHWHAGAQWMLGYLLDGDLASNHLSWQWVAGTGSSKAYLFNAENVAKYAPKPWHSHGTVIDTSYESLADIAMSATPLRDEGERYGRPHLWQMDGIQMPSRQSSPFGCEWAAPSALVADGRDVWLHHPWSVCPHPTEPGMNRLAISVSFAEAHATTPWSELRWHFVSKGLAALTPHMWWGSIAQVALALAGAKSVSWYSDPHVDTAFDRMRDLLQAREYYPATASHAVRQLFEPVNRYCQSFSLWWKHTKIAVD